MPYLTEADLNTHIYPEIISEITRADNKVAPKAIAAGIAEAKAYLGKYDLPKLFGTADVEAEVDDENLKNKVKDLACWHLIKLANPNIDVAMFRTAYEDALKFLKEIAKGMADPEGWPYRAVDANTGFPENAPVFYRSNSKRSNHY